jgi:hypothetical protein
MVCSEIVRKDLTVELLDSYFTFRIRAKALGEQGLIAARLIDQLRDNFNITFLVAQRVVEDEAATFLPRVTPGVDRFAQLKLFADVHFYLVSTANIWKALTTLDAHLDKWLKKSLKKDVRPYRHFFECADKMRDHFEHLSERVELLKNKPVFTSWSLDNWNFKMCGETVVVGPPAVQALVKIYRKLENGLEKIFPPQETNGPT